VSTDDEEIADIAKMYGAEVPFLRPSYLSDDYTATSAVIAHALDWEICRGIDVSEVCCIYATAPFLQANDLQRGLAALLNSGAEFAFSVTSYPYPIQRAIRITSTRRIEMFSPENFNTRSQDLEEAWHDAGQFYWGKPQAWLACKTLFSKDSVPVVLPRYRVQDIDTAEDWKRAEWRLRSLQGQV
jgi:N-acylneuraminate cytidylyltransferase